MNRLNKREVFYTKDRSIRRILLICMMKMNVVGNCHRHMTSPTVIQSVESMLPR